MRKLIVAEHISVDGVIQAPGGPREDPSDGFELGGWSAPYEDDVIGETIQQLFARPFELLLGRRTYDIWASSWPHVRSDSGPGHIADLFNGTIKHVATHRADSLAWKNSRALQGDVADAVRALLRESGPDLMTWGSSELVRQLLAAGLVDELWLIVYPVVLGHGKRLFGDDARASAFTIAHSASSRGGVIATRYVRSGEVKTGSYTDDR